MATVAQRVARLHAAAQAASDELRPGLAARRLRAGLRLLDGAVSDPEHTALRGRLLASLAWAESERGQVELGFALLDQAEPLVPPPVRPILLAQRALLLTRSWRNREALAELDRAVSLLDERTQTEDLVKALNNRSVVLLELGRVRPARADLRRCRELALSQQLVSFAAVSQVNLGCVDVVAGDLPAALGAFAAARLEYERLAPGRLPGLAVEQARALLAAGLFTDADRELAYAIDQARARQLSHAHAEALALRAEAALLGGEPAAAADWARQAQRRFLDRDSARRAALAGLFELRADQAVGLDPHAEAATSPEHSGIAARARGLAARLRQFGLREDARVAGLVAARALVAAGAPGRAKQIVTRHGPPGRIDRLDTRLLWRLTRAELAAAAGQTAEAGRQLRAGLATLHRHRHRFGCLDLQTGAAVHGRDLARAGLAAALASGSAAAVYRWSERARAQALLIPPVRPPDDPAAAAALEELRQVRQSLRAAELVGRPAGALARRAAVLQRTVREQAWATPGPGSTANGPTLAGLGEVTAELAGATLVSYLRDGPLLRALVVRGKGATLVPIGGYEAAAELVLRLRADLDALAGRAMPARLAAAVATATATDAAALSAAVFDPVRDLVADAPLVVVPTGALLAVPWSVLPGCAGRPVTVAPSVTSWLAARRRPATDRSGVLLVAGPHVPQAETELAAVARLHPYPTVLTGSAATPAATLAGLAQAGLAHLAAHGRHQPEQPLFSTLELVSGPLFGYDLPHLRQKPPTLVVLSACELGLAGVRPGDETLGMVSALLAAGSATVVASVALLADEAALPAMVDFHAAVAAGQAPSVALAGATSPDPPTGLVCFGAG